MRNCNDLVKEEQARRLNLLAPPLTKQDAREYLTKQKAAVDAGTSIDREAPPVDRITTRPTSRSW